MSVKAHAARGNLHDEFRDTFKVSVFGDLAASALLCGQEHQGIGLWLIFFVKSDGHIVSNANVRRKRFICDEPAQDERVRLAVLAKTKRRSIHSDNSMNQLRIFDLLQLAQRFEVDSIESVSVFQSMSCGHNH
jgi:hypothetical protein